MKRLFIVAALAATAVGVPLATAASPDTVEGQCEISGTATFTPNLTGTPGTKKFSFSGGGKCTGKLNGNSVTDAPIGATVSNSNAILSCAGSGSVSGPGKLTFTQGTSDPGDDVVVDFKFDEVSVGTEVPFHVAGAQGGDAVGEASFRDSAGPSTVTDCAGTGVSSLSFNATVVTVTPLKG